ncbi:MAG: hypothetical protein AAFQ87_26050 [Bacteroidota bacterium]
MSESSDENAPNEQVTEQSAETPTSNEESTPVEETPVAEPENEKHITDFAVLGP